MVEDKVTHEDQIVARSFWVDGSCLIQCRRKADVGRRMIFGAQMFFRS